MKFLVASLVLFAILSVKSFSQKFGEMYKQDIEYAQLLYKQGKYRKSAESFNATFSRNGNIAYLDDRYMAVRAWSMAGEPDSAFFHLFRIIDRAQYEEVDKVISDSTLKNLTTDPRWRKAIELMRANKQTKEAKYDRKLIAILDSVYQIDQRYRQTVHDSINKYGMNSSQMDKLNRLIMIDDSINLKRVISILDRYGWPGPDVIASHGNTIFLVIQHSDLTIQSKYLPVMKAAVKAGAVSKSSLALLEDRIALGQGKCQIYGTQIGYMESLKKYYVLPLSDPANVDQRRREVGLSTISEYLATWTIDWDKNSYLDRLRELLGNESLQKYECFRN